MADVQKNAFMLSSATLMMAPYGTDPFSLTPALHSVGLAAEVAGVVDASTIDLRSGVSQAIVDSHRTGVNATITASVREFTAQNFLRSLSLATVPVQVKRGVLTAAAAGSAVSLSIASDPIPGEAASAITAIGDIPSGATLLIQRAGDEVDYVFPTRSSGVATGAGPYTVPIAAPYAIPAAMSFAIGARVWVVNEVPVGSSASTDLFSVKITGTLANFDRPVTLIAPKVSVIKGFNLSFTETDYGSLPFEMRPTLLSASEATGRLAEIGTKAPMRLYAG